MVQLPGLLSYSSVLYSPFLGGGLRLGPEMGRNNEIAVLKLAKS